jgi:hypothetical protein
MSASKRPTSQSAGDAAPRRKKRVRKHALTPAEREWASLVAQGVSYRRASEECGLNPDNSSRLAKTPLMLKHLATLKTQVAKYDALRVAEFAKVTRTEIIGGLALLAKIHPATTHGISGQVSAYMGLAKIMGMLVDRQVNLDEFLRGWTDEELERYAVTGQAPDRVTGGQSTGA